MSIDKGKKREFPNDMPNDIAGTSDKDIQAAEWLLDIKNNKDLTDDTCVEMINWLRQDDENEKLYQRSEDVWALTEGLKHDEDIQNFLLEDITEEPENSPENMNISPVNFVRKYAVYLGSIAATLILAFVAVIHYGFSPWQEAPIRTALYQTQVGEQRTILLSDGTEVLLNTNTRMKVRYAPEVRHVFLDYGEAFFSVETDKNRPFVVNTDVGNVTVLGTRFNVKTYNDLVKVSLLEGKVEVKSSLHARTDTGQQTYILLPGQQSILSVNGLPEQPVYVDIDHVTEWREGRLSFYSMKLEDVVEEVNRYTDTKLVIEDGDLKEVLVTAIFKTDNFNSIFEALQKSFNIQNKKYAGKTILYREKTAGME